jgi:hypothetical protein
LCILDQVAGPRNDAAQPPYFRVASNVPRLQITDDFTATRQLCVFRVDHHALLGYRYFQGRASVTHSASFN